MRTYGVKERFTGHGDPVGEGAARTEADDHEEQHRGQVCDLRDADARVDDEQPAPDACRGERRGQRRARRRRLRDALGRDRQRLLPQGRGRDHLPRQEC